MKKAKPRSKDSTPSEKDSLLEYLDEAEESYSNITALAQLLLWCDTKHLDPAAIPRVGYMILSETEQLTTILQGLRKSKAAQRIFQKGENYVAGCPSPEVSFARRSFNGYRSGSNTGERQNADASILQNAGGN
jgi:hypothetical protein